MKILMTTLIIIGSISSFARSVRPTPPSKHVMPAQLNYRHSLVCDIAQETTTQNMRNKRLYKYNNQVITSTNNKKHCYRRFENHLKASCRVSFSRVSKRISRRVTLRMYKPGGNAKDSFATMTKERVCGKPVYPKPIYNKK